MPLTPPADQPPGASYWTAEEVAWALGLARAILAVHEKLDPAVAALLTGEPVVEAVLTVEPLGEEPLPAALLAPALPPAGG